jgi:nicotinamidase-related amidase
MSSKKCLLVIDVQNGMFNLSRPLYQSKFVLSGIVQLIKKARKENSKVIYLQHCGSEKSPFKKGTSGWKLHPLINPKSDEYIIEKKYSDSFQDTRLNEILMKSGVKQVVVCGLVTEGCVDTTIRRAYSLGYNIELAADCHSTTDSNILTAEQIIKHHNQVLKIFSEVKEAEKISFKD